MKSCIFELIALNVFQNIMRFEKWEFTFKMSNSGKKILEVKLGIKRQ